MNFEQEINEMENQKFEGDFIVKKGGLPILFTAPHTMKQVKENGEIKFPESYTKAIAMYLNKYFDTSYMIKIKDTGLDANRDNNDEFKKEMIDFIKDNNIKLVIDLHGASPKREFDVEFGTLDDLTASINTVKTLEKSFTENGIAKVEYNNPFKGGAITQYIYKFTKAEVVQVEINLRYRDFRDIDNVEKLCNCFSKFIEKYNLVGEIK